METHPISCNCVGEKSYKNCGTGSLSASSTVCVLYGSMGEKTPVTFIFPQSSLVDFLLPSAFLYVVCPLLGRNILLCIFSTKLTKFWLPFNNVPIPTPFTRPNHLQSVALCLIVTVNKIHKRFATERKSAASYTVFFLRCKLALCGPQSLSISPTYSTSLHL